jgi:putative sigma-54 modulation protein
MRITIKGENVDVTDPLQKYAEKKVERLGKYLPIKEAIVTQSVQRNWHIVEVTLEGDGILLRGEERSDSMYASIDQVVEKLESQIKRFKGKLMARAHPGEPPKEHIPAAEEGEVEETPLETPAVVRNKKFTMKPMSPDEAAMEMELLNHDFFIFQNDETESINVIYKRQDGDYGLIEPEV